MSQHVSQQRICIWIPIRWMLFQTVQNDGFQSAWDVAIDVAWASWRFFDDNPHESIAIRMIERRSLQT